MRPPRDFDATRPSRHHVFNRVAGPPDWHPFTDQTGQPNHAGQRLLQTILHFVRPYFCQLDSLTVMGNHYHIVLQFEARRKVSRKELNRRASLLWGDLCVEKTRHWGCSQYRRFSDRLFELPDLMHDLGGQFASWFNRKNHRRGPLWADRYKNAELLDLEAVQECVLYCELNPVRAGLAALPEEWELSSARRRRDGSSWARDLTPLSELFPEAAQARVDVGEWYRAKLLWRATAASKQGDRVISSAVALRERETGCERGAYRSRRRFFTDGKAIGPARSVRKAIEGKRENGFYTRRRHPVSQMGGLLYTLREQRSNARLLECKRPEKVRTPRPASRDGPEDRLWAPGATGAEIE